MTVFINNHTVIDNGNGFYVLDLIKKLNLNPIKIISLSYKQKNKSDKIFILSNKKKANTLFKKIIEIFLMYYLIFKNFRELKNEKIIFTSDPPMIGLALIIIKKFIKIRIIFWCQDIFPDTLAVSEIIKKKSFFFFILKLINQIILTNVDKIVTISRSMKKTLITEYKINASKVAIIENWNSLNINKKIKIKKKKINIFYNGNISRIHDEKFALKIIKRINNRDINFKIYSNSKKINSNQEKEILKKGFLSENSFYKCILRSDFQMIFAKPDSLKYTYPSKIYNILYYQKPIIYFNKNGNDEISNFLNKYNIGLKIDNKNKERIINLFLNTKKVKSIMQLFSRNYKKFYFDSARSKKSFLKWENILQ
jgi:hypothetical protein